MSKNEIAKNIINKLRLKHCFLIFVMIKTERR